MIHFYYGSSSLLSSISDVSALLIITFALITFTSAIVFICVSIQNVLFCPCSYFQVVKSIEDSISRNKKIMSSRIIFFQRRCYFVD